MTSRSYFGKMNLILGSVVPLAMFKYKMSFFSNDYELVQMLGSISATDGHACMLRAMCEVSKLLSSHTGAILRKKSSLIVGQFHVRLEQF